MLELSVILNIITIVIVIAMVYITLVAYQDREVRTDTAIDVLKQLYNDDNALGVARARIVPKYGEMGDFTTFDTLDYDYNKPYTFSTAPIDS